MQQELQIIGQNDLLKWEPSGKRKRGLPRTRWKDDIVAVAGRRWTDMAKINRSGHLRGGLCPAVGKRRLRMTIKPIQ